MDLTVKLDKRSSTPLQKQLYEALRHYIQAGVIQPGEALPSTRSLAETLGISRITALAVYRKLNAEGLTEVDNGKTIASRQITPPAVQRGSAQQNDSAEKKKLLMSAFARRIAGVNEQMATSADLPELNYGAIDASLLPDRVWQRILRKACDGNELHNGLKELDVAGYRPLREALARYFRRTRGVRCQAEQVIIFSNPHQALDAICRLLLETGDLVAVENPGFVGARQTFSSAGAQLLPVDVDGEGMQVDSLIQAQAHISMVFFSSVYQDPTGVLLSPSRRTALLRWAQQRDTILIEDDFDFLFSYDRQSYRSVQGCDETGHVIYLASFWKVLFPLSAIGVVIVPNSLVTSFERMKILSDRTSSLVESIALYHFLEEGQMDAHIAKSRQECGVRRRALKIALIQTFQKDIEIKSESSGTVRARFKTILEEETILRAAKNAGLEVISARPFYAGSAPENEFLISFVCLEPSASANLVPLWARLMHSL